MGKYYMKCSCGNEIECRTQCIWDGKQKLKAQCSCGFSYEYIDIGRKEVEYKPEPYEIWYDCTLKSFHTPIWRVGSYGVGFKTSEIATHEAEGFRRVSEELNCVCGFCYDIRGNYKVHWKNGKGKEILKPLYENTVGYFIKIGKKQYYLSKAEEEWLKLIMSV